jgi:hypothetical protein
MPEDIDVKCSCGKVCYKFHEYWLCQDCDWEDIKAIAIQAEKNLNKGEEFVDGKETKSV